ncbi:DUF6612 family protein [Paenibacillus donghaensis]|uniref:DUF4412 domain-containing protein n=1 Tax=Paenibacillus donghaensis TaxID=414771 RepID=A0A2Z2KIB3_9BACL|nr:DUF6612 family protein [Paenibacillus donghaensis]ASA25944.1 hypothetical protein B9T62_37675 [Paenibacillus donghaensis]
MKKWTIALLGAMLTVSITACGNDNAANGNANATADPAVTAAAPASTPATTEEAAPEAATGTPTVDELIQKTTEASQKLNSFELEMSMVQNIAMTQGETKNEQKVDMKTTSQFTKEPMQMHQEVVMTMPGQEGEQKIEQYITKGGVYSLTNGQWAKLPESMTDSLITTMEQSASPEKQMEQFKAISKDTKVTEDGDNYVLTADVSGDQVKELAKNYMGQSDPSMSAMMDQMNIDSMTLTYAVNKETYLPTRTDVNMVMDMKTEGQSVNLDMKMESTISKHNEIKEIKVPEEALKAKEMEIPSAPATN